MQRLEGYEGKRLNLKLNGHKVASVVTIEFEMDQMPIAGEDFDFGSKRDNDAYAKRFETGELLSVVISVTVRAEGLEGIDTLGAVHVKASRFTQDVLDAVADHTMIGNASDALLTEIQDAAKRLVKYNRPA